MVQLDELDPRLDSFIQYKQEEFLYQGYQTVFSADLKEYLVDFLWKRKYPTSFFEQLYAISQITPNDYFDYESLKAQINRKDTLETIDLSDLL